MTWVSLVLLALAGFLLGGVVATWHSSRPLTLALGVGAALATAGGVVWLL